MSDEITAAIGDLDLPGDAGRLREGARRLDESIGELAEAKRLLREIELGGGGRFRRFHDALHAVLEGTRHALRKDADALEEVRERSRQFARVLEDLQDGEIPAILTRWQRVRAEAISGGPRADDRVAEVERDLADQYHDVLRKLGGRQLLHDLEGARWVRGGDDRDGAGPRGAGETEGRVQIYRHTLAGILEDLDHAVRRWRAAKRDVAEALHAARPTAVEVGDHGGRRVGGDEEHDRLKDVLERLDQVGPPLEQARDALTAAVDDLREGRRGDRPGRRGAHREPAEEDGGDGRGWQLGEFRDAWAEHLDDVAGRLRRTAGRIQELRDEVRNLDEKFASTLGD